MKFNFIQGDFSGGELSPRARGHVESDAYKAGLSLASNVVPTRTGSIASRAGLKAVLEGVDALFGTPSNLPVQHVDVHDGPYGDFVIEVSPTGLRFLDRGGVLPWDFPPASELLQFTVQDGAYAYGADRTVYLRSDAPTPRSYYLTRGSGAQNALLPVRVNVPAGTNNQWIFSGKIAGDAITAHIVQSTPANFQDIAIAPDASGNFSVVFRPNIGGVDQDFYIQLKTAAGTTATNLWDINLIKNNVKTIHDTLGAILALPTGDVAPLMAPEFNGSVVAPTPERVRAGTFWARDDFWVAFAGGRNNGYAGFALRWHNNAALVAAVTKAFTDGTAALTLYAGLQVFTTDAPDLASYNAAASAAATAAITNDSVVFSQALVDAAAAVALANVAWAGGALEKEEAAAATQVLTRDALTVRDTADAAAATPVTGWTFGSLPCTANSLAQIVGANAVAVFQDRLWYGINLVNGKRAVRASVVGYGRAWGYAAQTFSTGAPRLNGNDWLFQFTVEKEQFITPTGFPFFAYHFPADDAKATVLATVNGEVRAESADFLQPGHYFDYQASDGVPEAGGPYNLHQGDQTRSPGGVVAFRGAAGPPYPVIPGSNPGDSVIITRVALADDPLDLNLASPSGRIAWLNVLRGLVLGTTRNEKLFQRGVLAIDPATGQSFDIEDESNYGGDPALPALDINDKVLFVQQGRRVLRYAGLSITTNGGLVSEDVGVAGEHLTRARVRSLCFLKSPVPRVVMGFDDGTGAVMTILTERRVAFSRLTIPACFGGIYNVAALNTSEDSELWVGTENGVTLWAATFESDVTSKELLVPAAGPWAGTHVKYDTETPLPPVMDGWKRLPLVYVGGVAYVTGLPACMVGQNVWALVNGQLYGPQPVVAGGKVVVADLDPDLNTTWVDAAGLRRVQEVYVGLPFPEHRFTTLPLEGGNPVGSSQNLTSRKPQLYLRLVDSYLPLVNGTRLAERGADDATDALGGRVTADRRATEEGYQRGGVVDVVMDVPLRMEIAAVHGGVVMNNI